MIKIVGYTAELNKMCHLAQKEAIHNFMVLKSKVVIKIIKFQIAKQAKNKN